MFHADEALEEDAAPPHAEADVPYSVSESSFSDFEDEGDVSGKANPTLFFSATSFFLLFFGPVSCSFLALPAKEGIWKELEVVFLEADEEDAVRLSSGEFFFSLMSARGMEEKLESVFFGMAFVSLSSS